MSLCPNCKNIIDVDYSSMGGVYTCILAPSMVRTDQVKRCNKFEEKEDTKDKPKAEAKSVANKGKYPRKQPKKKERPLANPLADRDIQVVMKERLSKPKAKAFQTKV